MRSSLGFLMDGGTACCLSTLGAYLAWTGTGWSWCTLGSGTMLEVSSPGDVVVPCLFVVGDAATCVALIGKGV